MIEISRSEFSVGGTNWDHIFNQLVLSGLFFAGQLVVVYSAKDIYGGQSSTLKNFPKISERVHRVRIWIVNHLGSQYGNPKESEESLAILVAALNLVFSLITTFVWVHKTYVQQVSTTVMFIDFICGCFFVFLMLLNLLKAEMQLDFLFTWTNIKDIITFVPLIFQPFLSGWISLSYLRASFILQAYKNMDSMGVFNIMSDMNQGIMLTTITVLIFVFNLAATQFVLELLGPFEWLKDSFITTKTGDDISMWQMMYWVLSTISTVGYGRFAPTTCLSRLFNTVATIAGVMFFTIETGKLYELKREEDTGRGKFFPKWGSSGHALVLGGACDTAAVSVLSQFLQELLHPSRGRAVPEVLLMCYPYIHSKVHALGKQQWSNGRVRFLSGSGLKLSDLVRAKASRAEMVFVLANIFSSAPDVEDHQNIMLACFMLKHFPYKPLRLMLLRPDNRKFAMELGVPMNFCFAVNELKAHLLAQSCITLGFIPFVLNLTRSFAYSEAAISSIKLITPPLRVEASVPSKTSHISGKSLISRLGFDNSKKSLMSDDASESSTPRRAAALGGQAAAAGESQSNAWMRTFMKGATHRLFGLLVHSDFVGMTFSQMATEMYKRTGAFAVALHIDGDMMINPGLAVRVHEGAVAFVAAKDFFLQVGPLTEAKNPREWIAVLRSSRRLRTFAKLSDPNAVISQQQAMVNRMTAVNVFDQILKSPDTIEGPFDPNHDMEVDELSRIFRKVMPTLDALTESNAPPLFDGSPFTNFLVVWGDHVPGDLEETLRATVYKRRGKHAEGDQAENERTRRPNIRSVPNMHAKELYTASVTRIKGNKQDIKKNKRVSVFAQGEESNLWLEKVVGDGGHVVVLAMDPHLGQQLEVLLTTLRQTFLHTWIPVVVLTPFDLPSRMIQRFPVQSGVVFYNGNPSDFQDLLHVGVLVAHSVVMIQNQPTSRDTSFMDQRMLIVASLIEAEQADLGRDVPLILDMHIPTNINQMYYDLPGGVMKWEGKEVDVMKVHHDVNEDVILPRTSGTSHLRGYLDTLHSHATLQRTFQIRKVLENSKKFMSRAFSTTSSGVISTIGVAWTHLVHPRVNANVDHTLHPRFASGRALSRLDLCRLFASAFFTPGVMEVVEALTMPSKRGQTAMLWLVPIPFEFVGLTFGELFIQLVQVGALPMGLYRGFDDEENDLKYVYSFPDSATELLPTDQVYVHAVPEWAAAVQSHNYKRFSAATKLQKAYLNKNTPKAQTRSRLAPWLSRKMSATNLKVHPEPQKAKRDPVNRVKREFKV